MVRMASEEMGFVVNGLGSRLEKVQVKRNRRTEGRWYCSCSRREFLLGVAGGLVVGGLPKRSDATGLKQFPLTEPLQNQYYFLRAGESTADAEGMVWTNPVDKLSVHNGLTRRGEDQMMGAAKTLADWGVGPAGDRELWVWSAVACKATQSAELLLFRMNLRRENVVPEYAFLDARGMGALEGEKEAVLDGLVHANDAQDPLWRMEVGEDGTPNGNT